MLWHRVVAEIFYLANCPTVRLEQGLDALLALLILIAGICFATSDYTSNCGFEWPCHNVRTAKIFDLIAVFFLLVSQVMTSLTSHNQINGPTGVQLQYPLSYHDSVTPTSTALSPIGDQYKGHALKV